MDFVLVKRVVDRMVRIVDDTELSKRLRGETKRIVLNCSACLDRACTLEDAGTMDERERRTIIGFVEYAAGEVLNELDSCYHMLVQDLRSLYNNLVFRPLPPEPTYAAPGTEEKISILKRRLESGYELFHPDDAVNYHDITDKLLQFCNKVHSNHAKSEGIGSN